VVTASEEAEAAGMMHYIVGHVGDGNFHIAYLVDPNIPASARPPSASTRRW
jgi:D-lactate dehydrogenase (cytochrome)